MATHSSIPWRLPWAEEPGRPQPMGSQESDRPPSPVLSRCWYLKVWHWFRSSQKESFHAKNQGCVLYHAKYLVKLSPTTYLERYESSLWFWKQSKYLVLTSVAKSCPTLCDPEDCSTPGFPVHHQLLKLTQTHIHWVSDTVQPFHPLPSPSPLTFSLYVSLDLKWVSLDSLCLLIQFSCVQLFVTHGLQHARLPCPSPTPSACSNSCSSSQWCHQAISSSVVPFSSCLQSFPASGSSPMSQVFASGGQSIGVSASASILPMNTQDWFPLGWAGWISLLSKGLSKVFSNTTVQKHQFFAAQLSVWSNSHICTWQLEKP